MPAFLFFLLNQALMLVLLFLNRLLLLWRFAPTEIWTQFHHDLLPVFVRGFRFDLKVTVFLWVIFLGLALFNSFIGKNRCLRLMEKLAKFLWPLFLLIIAIDQQYYTFYQSHINIFIFGLAEDDTRAVMASVWADHPFIRITLLLVFTSWLIFKALDFASIRLNHRKATRPKVLLATYLIYIPFHVMLMRGSFGIFPLMRDDAIVSNHPYLNYLVVNPFFAFKEALQEKNNLKTFSPESKILSDHNFTTLEEALSTLGAKDFKDFTSQTSPSPELEKNPPHVVFAQMESWSNFLLDFEGPNNHLLSSLGRHLKEDILFRNFFPAANSTISSMEALLLGKECEKLPFWNTPFRLHTLNTSFAVPFKEKDYETVFISSGKLGWRNLAQWAVKQGFDEAYGQDEIKRRYPDAQECSWGVYDEYSFRLAQDLLTEHQGKNQKPLFIYIMTTSNHTPYEVPTHFHPLPTHIPESLTTTLTTSTEFAEKSLIGFQYANKALGDFLDFIKSHDTAKNTVVAAAGDHNAWSLIPRNSEIHSQKDSLGVPLYFYIPPHLKNKLQIDTSRAASHKDIAPTLISLTLPNVSYTSFGKNIFEKATPSRNTFYGINGNSHLVRYLVSAGDDEKIIQKKAHAFAALNHIYFQRKFCELEPKWCLK